MQSVSADTVGDRRAKPNARSYRHAVCTLAYVRLDHANGGIIRNLSDSGMAIQAVGRLHPEQIVHLRFEFIRPRAKFEMVGEVAWANSNGQAGLRFTDVSLRTQRLLKDWMLTDLLAAAVELKAPILKTADSDDGLLLSHLPRQPIRLAADTGPNTTSSEEVLRDQACLSVPWWPVRIREHALARFVDGMIVISSVLLFSLIVAALTDVLPSWPVVALTGAAAGLAFAFLYCYICRMVIGRTLGWRLAKIAAQDNSNEFISSACEPY